MAEITAISWVKSTWNPWIGCQSVSPGCDHCYAQAMDARRVFEGQIHFGPHAPRYRTKASTWNQVKRWNRQAPGTVFAGQPGFWPVFCASLADVFDNAVDPTWRSDFWRLIQDCPNLTFLVLTKRIGNVPKMLPPDWGGGYQNVWLGSTVVNQDEADRDVPKLLEIPAHKRFLSMEPLLAPVDLVRAGWLESHDCMGVPKSAIDWVIVGGEAHQGARPMHPDWPVSLKRQCELADVPFHFKQWGDWAPVADPSEALSVPSHRFEDGACVQRLGAKHTGSLIEGREVKHWPQVSRHNRGIT